MKRLGVTAYICGRICTDPKKFIKNGTIWLSFFADVGCGKVHINMRSRKRMGSLRRGGGGRYLCSGKNPWQ